MDTYEILYKAIQNPELKKCINNHLEEMHTLINEISTTIAKHSNCTDEKNTFSFTVTKYVIKRLLDNDSNIKELVDVVNREIYESEKYTFLFPDRYENIRDKLRDLNIIFTRLMIIAEFYE